MRNSARNRGGAWGVGLGAAVAGLLTAVSLSAGAAPARNGRSGTRTGFSGRPPQVISVTTTHPTYRGAEVRLSQFIRAIYKGERAKAASFLSRRVSQRERQALVEKRWLRENPGARRDFTQILFQPDLQIRTREIYRNGADCYVIPRKAAPKRSRRRDGYLKVRMRLENDEWRVEMHP